MPHADASLTLNAPSWRWPLAFAVALLAFLAMDAVWLGLMSGELYQPRLGHLMAAAIDWRAAAVFYPLYIVGLVVFAVAPALARGGVLVAVARGAGVGLVAYGTYDLTNQATLRDWPWVVTLVDLCWGAVVSGSAAGTAAGVTLVTCRRVNRTSAQ